MDKQELDAFNESMKNPPPVTRETVLATVERLVAESGTIFRRGLVNAFSELSRDYRSNDGFKIGERIVLEHGVSFDKNFHWFTASHYNEQRLADIDRVVHVLDGKGAPTWPHNLPGRLSQMCRECKKSGDPTVFETDYWRVRFFKKGTIHLWMKDDELRAKANRLIAEHFGEVVAGPADARAPTTDNIDIEGLAAKDLNFFATSPEIADYVVDLAEISAGDAVLEPSAGEGALALSALRFDLDTLDCIEIDPKRSATLSRAISSALELRPNKKAAFTVSDFLTLEPSARLPYDRVIMNPPFSNGRDVIHTLHAYRFLKRGGRLVAIVAAGAVQRDNRFSAALRALKPTIYDLPEGSFSHAGTMVRTQVLVIDKE